MDWPVDESDQTPNEGAYRCIVLNEAVQHLIKESVAYVDAEIAELRREVYINSHVIAHLLRRKLRQVEINLMQLSPSLMSIQYADPSYVILNFRYVMI